MCSIPPLRLLEVVDDLTCLVNSSQYSRWNFFTFTLPGSTLPMRKEFTSSCKGSFSNHPVPDHPCKLVVFFRPKMVVTAGADAYLKILEYGVKKTQLRIDRLLLQAFMAGIFVAMAGHCCTVLAGSYPTDPGDPLAVAKPTQKFIYGALFPVAFICIILTGAELFTGNTMTMLICYFQKRVTMLQLGVNWLGSLAGNWLGALFGAYFLSYLTGALGDEHVRQFLFRTCVNKISYGWGECFLRGVGCNTFVCLAVWAVIASENVAGKVLVMWFPIVAFCVGGYEHIIANMYTLQAGLMAGAPVAILDVIAFNFLPTLLGNIVGGCLLVGAVYAYNFYPTLSYTETTGAKVYVQEVGPVLDRRSSMQVSMTEREPDGQVVTEYEAVPFESFGGEYIVNKHATMAAPIPSRASSFLYPFQWQRQRSQSGNLSTHARLDLPNRPVEPPSDGLEVTPQSQTAESVAQQV
ncbi:formate/nitrite transporter protein [Toxoplasma gondii RUB]|uniref:Formate/nitrite transporter protein n=2 Tax=Toxoplasma gondii TaxID=5811 RepID=A0A086M1Z0_TOXGO|nr:formate/nitrite transporter protein [Toxoplasma gondii RUB]KFH12698.1 formate/nitrite transporter protein [Toxoplasma gondii VAND]